MVNFSRHETDEKAQPLKILPASKGICKAKANGPWNVRAKPVDVLKSQTYVALKCNSAAATETSGINKTSYSNTAIPLTTEHFQPFSNHSLFPSSLQTLLHSNPQLTPSELTEAVLRLRVPANTLSFRKKLEKFKLLSLSQETFVQNYLKDKYQASLNPSLLRDYYGYIKTKIQLTNQIEAVFGRPGPDSEPLPAFGQAKSYLCTPTTTFNESLLTDELNESRDVRMKFEDCEEFFERNPGKNFYDYEGHPGFKSELEFKHLEQAKQRCRDYHYDDFFHFKQENNLENDAMKFMINDWQD